MSELVSSTPIHGLSQDILIYIFTLNADMFTDKHALHTTRFTSQVCREWRDLLLGASFLWARLIDLDLLYYNRYHVWRNELMCRSGAAPLWIKFQCSGMAIYKRHGPVTLTAGIENIRHFFCRIVRDNWHRIQKLVRNRGDQSSDITHSMLRYPAPYLQYLTVSLDEDIAPTTEPGKDGTIVPIFANHAPFLRILTLRGYMINYRAPWLSQLHVLELDGKYDARDALAVLLATYSLREVRITLDGHSEDTSPIRNVSLPFLEFLVLNASLPHQAAIFLNHIMIPINCFLAVRADYPRGSHIRNTDYLHLISVFSHYVLGYLHSHQGNIVGLNYTWTGRIIWKCRTISSVGYSEVGLRMVVPDVVVSSVFEMVLKCLVHAQLSSVLAIHFFGWDKSVCPHAASVGGHFFRRLTSVHTLFTDVNSLALLMHLINQENSNITCQPSTILPSLSLVNLEMYNPYMVNFPVDSQTAEFFLSRLQSGYPIRVLHLSDRDLEPFGTRPNLHALEEVKGLKVSYKLWPTREIFEYICGSGYLVQRPAITA